MEYVFLFYNTKTLGYLNKNCFNKRRDILLEKQEIFDEMIIKKDEKVLNRAKNIVGQYTNKDLIEYEEYHYLYNKFKKLLEQAYYIFEISDTYQDQLIKTKEDLKLTISDKKESEKKLNKKIQELKNKLEDLKKTNEKLENMATRDHLTGLYNRQEFEKVLKKEWRYAIRESEPIALVMIDIDNFKNFNDHYGHLAGDNCLQDLSKSMQNSLKRPRDFIARFGGEEFVVILPETDEDGAKHTAEKIRKSVYDLQIPHKYSNVEDYITISLGIAQTDEAELFIFEEVLDAADHALYKAKESGKNKFCFKKLKF